MPLMTFLLQCTAALCCFSVMLHNVWHLGGMAPSPINPPFPIPNSSPSFHSPLLLLHSISPSLLSPYLHLCLFLLFLVFSTPSPSFSLTRTFFYPCFSLSFESRCSPENRITALRVRFSLIKFLLKDSLNRRDRT